MQPVHSGSKRSKDWLSGAARGVGYGVDEVDAVDGFPAGEALA